MRTHEYIQPYYKHPYRILKKLDVSPAEALNYYNDQMDLGRSLDEVEQEIEIWIDVSIDVTNGKTISYKYYTSLKELRESVPEKVLSRL